MKRFPAIFLALFVPVVASGAHANEDPAPALELILAEAAADGFGGQIALMRGGEIIYSGAAGFADNARRVPVREDTLYHVASITKFMTAILTLQAVEEGKLSLDDPASALFPDSPLALREFTLRDLLDHRSGLRSTYAAEDERDAGKAVKAIAEANAENPKDGDFHYSNDGYDLLAILIERAYGAPYETVFREKIAAPAGLQHYGFWGEAAISDPAVVGQPRRKIPRKLKRRNYGMIGSAGFLISAGDLVRLRRALDAGEIISAPMLAELNEPRDEISIGRVLYGAFLIDAGLGPAISVRGAEDWGDNAYLNHYLACDLNVAVTTSRGAPEEEGASLFRDRIIREIEESIAPLCAENE